jgi:hypothetical protein
MPPRYPPYQTCQRWFQEWGQDGVFKQILSELAEDLYKRGGIDIRETFIDGSFTSAKKGAILSAIQSAAKAPRSSPLQTLLVFLIAIEIHSASPHEIKLVEATIKSRFIQRAPKPMIGDKAYDSDPVDQRLL